MITSPSEGGFKAELRGPGASAAVPSAAGASPGLAGLGSSPESGGGETLIGIDEVQKTLNRSRASVYRYTNTDPRNLNPPFNPRRLNPEYRSDQKDPLLFHPHEVARFARDVLRIKEVTVEVLNSPSTATQQLLGAILEELRTIRSQLDRLEGPAARPVGPTELAPRLEPQSRPAA
ncbi:resolvase [Cyanobium sp. NIES-981]|uniref:resolvase n=1 Tax=Cyanobium sp. NIES-981 TaxID=1851505 RepID=UPI0012FC9449|nr:resolvase [Cyanobium sp. NIES-981]